MTTAVSSGGKSSPAKIVAASPATKVALAMPLAAALARAKAIDVALTSTPANALESWRRRQGEQPASAVGVDEAARAAAGGLIAHVGREGRQDEGVVLEKIAGEESQPQGAQSGRGRRCPGGRRRREGNFLGDHGVVIGDHPFGGVAEQHGRTAREGFRPRPHFRAHVGEPGVDGVGGDVAAGHVDDLETGALAEEPDGKISRGTKVEGRRHRRGLRPGRGSRFERLILENVKLLFRARARKSAA